MKKLMMCLTPMFLFACGGVEGDEAHDESNDAIVGDEGDEDAQTAAHPAANAAELEFDRLIKLPRFVPLKSKVKLAPGEGCPTTIQDGSAVPFRCLVLLSKRHTTVPDVDIVEPETMIHFHRLNSTNELASLISDCAADRVPNGIADLRSEEVRAFMVAGHVRRQGERRYHVLYRRVGDEYRVLPGRPSGLISAGSTVWTVVKPGASACLRPAD